MFIIDNQVLLLILFFVAGLIGTVMICSRPAGHRAWLMADLVWVVLGLFGALGAVIAGIYKADSSQLKRQIDIAYAATADFDSDAARFRLRYCETPVGGPLAVLCDKADFLSASTAENAELPLFISITEAAAPLQGLHLFVGRPDDGMNAGEMAKAADRFDPNQFLAFTALDDATRDAIATLRASSPSVAADYQVLAQSYQMLITQVGALKDEWEFLQSRSYILHIQIIAICLVSFAAPFRLGKSMVELLQNRQIQG